MTTDYVVNAQNVVKRFYDKKAKQNRGGAQ